MTTLALNELPDSRIVLTTASSEEKMLEALRAAIAAKVCEPILAVREFKFEVDKTRTNWFAVYVKVPWIESDQKYQRSNGSWNTNERVDDLLALLHPLTVYLQEYLHGRATPTADEMYEDEYPTG